jgi:hypothetical protein
MADGGQGRNRTGVHGFAGRCMTTLPPGHPLGTSFVVPFQKNKTSDLPRFVRAFLRNAATDGRSSLRSRGAHNNGAGNETRTRDPDLGKVVLYQLSYSRARAAIIRFGPFIATLSAWRSVPATRRARTPGPTRWSGRRPIRAGLRRHETGPVRRDPSDKAAQQAPRAGQSS